MKLGHMRLDIDQEAKLRRMVAGGFTLAGIAGHLGITHHQAKLMVQWYDLRKKAPPRGPRHKPNDFQLREVPLSDPYILNVGPDRYLEALKRHFPERIP